MRGDTDSDAASSEVFYLAQVVGRRVLTEARQAPSSVGGEEEHDRDPGLVGRLDGRQRLREAEIVELSHRRVAGSSKLAVHLDVVSAHELRCLALRLCQHQVAPRPEVPAAGSPAQGPLKGVAMGIHKTRQTE